MLAGCTTIGSWSTPAAERQGCSTPAPLRLMLDALQQELTPGVHAKKEGVNPAAHRGTSRTPAAGAGHHH